MGVEVRILAGVIFDPNLLVLLPCGALSSSARSSTGDRAVMGHVSMSASGQNLFTLQNPDSRFSLRIGKRWGRGKTLALRLV